MKLELARLSSLQQDALHHEACVRSKRLVGAEWDMAVCLLAIENSKAYEKLGCSSAVVYASQKLDLPSHKAAELLRVARELEQLPLLAEAFSTGQINWSKMREICRVAEPATESKWLEAALTHTSEEIQRAVSQTPSAWKREQMKKENDNQPQQQELMLEAPAEPKDPQAPHLRAGTCGVAAHTPNTNVVVPVQSLASGTVPFGEAPQENAAPGTGEREGGSVPYESCGNGLSTANAAGEVQFPACPKLVRFSVAMTPDEYAIFEQAVAKVRSKMHKSVRREAALVELATHYLSSGDARSRLRHNVTVHYDPNTESAWYVTDRGALPADRTVVEEALANGSVTAVMEDSAANVPRAEEAQKPTSDLTLLEPVEQPPQNEQFPQDGQPPQNKQMQIDLPQLEPAGSDRKTKPVRGHQAFPQDGSSSGKSPLRRPALPAAVMRAVLARANGMCEVPGCNSKGPLHFHHKVPWSRVREHRTENLELRCSRCHSTEHAVDYQDNEVWRNARERARSRG